MLYKSSKQRHPICWVLENLIAGTPQIRRDRGKTVGKQGGLLSGNEKNPSIILSC